MSVLPQVKQVVHKIKLPSNGKSINIRPFTVAEERMLLTAKLANKEETITETIKQVLSNCTLGKADVGSLPLLDIEYLFLQLKKYSVSEINEVSVSCPGCEAQMKLSIPIDDITVIGDDVKDTLEVGETIDGKKLFIKVAQPSLDTMIEVKNGQVGAEDEDLYTIYKCIVSVYEEDGEVTDFSDVEFDQFKEWFTGLTGALKAFLKFVQAGKHMSYEQKLTCPTCAQSNKITLRGIQDFFG